MENPYLPGDVMRRQVEKECGAPVGQLNILIRGQQDYQTVSFYCTKPKFHLDECEFVGKDLIVRKRRRE